MATRLLTDGELKHGAVALLKGMQELSQQYHLYADGLDADRKDFEAAAHEIAEALAGLALMTADRLVVPALRDL